MKISIQQSNQLKAIAILMMLCLHLFNTLDYAGLFIPLVYIGDKPLIYYVSLFCDACVPIFAFVSGYGLYFKYKQDKITYSKGNFVRLKKLYVNYWIILLLFAVGLGVLFKVDGYPGGVVKFILNFTGLNATYNGAWWFFTIYVFFVLSSSFWFGILTKLNAYLYLFSLFLLYLIGFYFRIYKTNIFTQDLLNWLHTQGALYFSTLFQFMLGAFALEFSWSQKVSNWVRKVKFPQIISVLFILVGVVFHAFVPNFIVAPFTGLVFIFAFLQFNLPKWLSISLDYLSVHSTNMWLIHMFFYLIYFRAFVYSFDYVVLIYLVLVILCLLSSHFVNFINYKINKGWA